MASTLDVPIVQKQRLEEDIVEITCRFDGSTLPFKAGQHIRVSLPSLYFSDDKGKTRTFNILSSPNNTEYISFAFVNSDSGFKKTINQLKINSMINLQGPFGMFTLPENNKDIIFISEGIGIVPCISMILYATEELFSNKITMIYSGNKKIPYHNDLQTLKDTNKNFTFHTKTGTLDKDFVNKNISNVNDSLFYISGNTKTTSSIKQILLQKNIPISNIKIEEFAGY